MTKQHDDHSDNPALSVNEASAAYRLLAGNAALVRPGYKLTEVGVMPEDWLASPLGKHATFRTGPFGSALHKSDYTNDGIPVVNPMHIVDGKIEPTRTMTITEQAAKDLSDFRLKPGEIVIGRRGDMGRCAVVRENQTGWLCGTGSMIIRPLNTDAEFLQRVLSSPKAISAIEDSSVGTTMVNLNQGVLARLKIQFAPLPEQRAIAAALSDVDALLDGLERLIAKRRDLKQAAMQQLLTGQTRLPGFSGEWNRVYMMEILTQKATYGIVTAGAFVQNGVLMVRGGDIVDGRINTDLPMVSYEKAAEYARTTLVKDDVVIALVGYPGASAKISEELIGANISRAVGLLRLNGKISADYLVCFLNSSDGRRMVLAPSAGSAQQVVNLDALNKLQFTIPPIPEQTTITTILSDMDAELAALEARRDKTRALKQGMMQELLTGKTRLL